ncbi:uncharacterized protein I303_106706 [Kwoniella dejecticola CBS 10117]|uniref:DUF6534 domain-containing protein n=1 Tax=Kwoniella dejecticola CBS 10117 TaxID=1296121 RepID=A0A1A5ZTX8_9TREE|nr:uncharacterized protein I303_08652 [Kwoniella dejecticola CBS 10117]OBR81266.1 hypothetical protein I303_08652 [Kwoniella dejecticola CBS 10117]
MNVNAFNSDTIGGFDEAGAKALFAKDAKFMLQCQMASLIIDTFLAGVLLPQFITYFMYQKDDKLWTKGVVLWCSLWSFAITCYYWAYMSYLFVDCYGLWLPWLEVRWLALMPLFDVLCVCVVQSFFAYRAYLLVRRNKFIYALITALILAAAGGGIGVTIVFGSQPSLLGADKSGPTLITWTATTTAADVVIAICILWGLLQSKSGWSHTDKLVTRLIRLTFEAQLPPTFLAMAYVIEWSQTPSSLLGAVFQALQSKAYTIGLLFTLNARLTFTVSQDATKSHVTPQVYAMTDRKPTQLEVTVQQETYIHNDMYAQQNAQQQTKHAAKSDSISDYDEQHAVTNENGSRARLTSPDNMA